MSAGLSPPKKPLWSFHVACALLVLTVSAESFGTNIRSTAATSIPNFVRATVVPMSLLLLPLRDYLPNWQANLTVGLTAFGIALIGVFALRETFGISLEYLE